MFGPEENGTGTGSRSYMDIDTGDIIVIHDNGAIQRLK